MPALPDSRTAPTVTWSPADMDVLARNRRVIAAVAIGLERGWWPDRAGPVIAGAFPELADAGCPPDASALPVVGLGHLPEAAKRAMAEEASRDLFADHRLRGGREPWTEADLRLMLSLPRVLAAIEAFRRWEYMSLHSFMGLAFSPLYDNQHWMAVFPVAGLDDLSGSAFHGLIRAAWEEVGAGRVEFPDDLERRFPDVFAERQGWD